MDLSSLPTKPGQILDGKYQVESMLGIGAMGIVVSAVHLGLGDRVAVKVLHPKLGANELQRKRFLREARLASKIKSSHVVRMIDAGQTEEHCPYIVMEMLEGCDLDSYLAKQGALLVSEALELILQACEGLAEAHARGIVHRDLKPSNLYMHQLKNGENILKILDFGVSKVVGEHTMGLTQEGVVLGTPVYMAPEQVKDGELGAFTDVWAIGVIFYQLLTERLPFGGTKMADLFAEISWKEPISILELRPDLEPGIVQVIETCLQKDPKDRYQNAAEFVRDLHRVVPSALVERTMQRVDFLVASASLPDESDNYSAIPSVWPASNRQGFSSGGMVNQDSNLPVSHSPTLMEKVVRDSGTSLKKDKQHLYSYLIIAALSISLIVSLFVKISHKTSSLSGATAQDSRGSLQGKNPPLLSASRAESPPVLPSHSAPIAKELSVLASASASSIGHPNKVAPTAPVPKPNSKYVPPSGHRTPQPKSEKKVDPLGDRE
jgi:serine/threonine protein kinase